MVRAAVAPLGGRIFGPRRGPSAYEAVSLANCGMPAAFQTAAVGRLRPRLRRGWPRPPRFAARLRRLRRLALAAARVGGGGSGLWPLRCAAAGRLRLPWALLGCALAAWALGLAPLRPRLCASLSPRRVPPPRPGPAGPAAAPAGALPSLLPPGGVGGGPGFARLWRLSPPAAPRCGALVRWVSRRCSCGPCGPSVYKAVALLPGFAVRAAPSLLMRAAALPHILA